MAKKNFSPAERYAVFTVHGEKCYMCTTPLDLSSMQVDHVIPEVLVDKPELTEILAAYSLPTTFDLQSYENWLPSCGRCNNLKKARVFRSTPRIQLELEIAAEKAPDARTLEKKVVSKQVFAKAWNTIQRALKDGSLSPEQEDNIRQFAKFHAKQREPEIVSTPVRFTPLIQVLSENGGLRVVKGPHGVGVGPSTPHVSEAARCVCGSGYWNGARCVVCGLMDDD